MTRDPSSGETEPIPFLEDFVMAKVTRKRLRTGAICRAARSEEISTGG